MLHDWANLFEITGAAGAQLIGLLFVGVTLGVGLSSPRVADGVRGFITPTLVNFGGVLLQAILMLAPWPSLPPLGVALALCGLAALAYRIPTVILKRQLDFIELSGLDRVVYNAAPLVADVALIAGGAGVFFGNPLGPFAVAAASTLLLFAGVYGAWDLTLWIVRQQGKS
jgi:hypothetical protein